MIDKSTRLLSICCSFRRPTLLRGMLKSYYDTKASDKTEVFVYLHLDDPHLEEYRAFIDDYQYKIDRHRCLQEVINHVVFEVYPEIPYYQVIVDDHVCRTMRWDEMLISALERNDGWGFACARDLVNNDNWHNAEHPSGEIFSWKQASTLGYAYPRNFMQTGMDFYAKDLGKSLGALTLVPEAIIEHLWYHGSDRPMDKNLAENYSQSSLEYAHKAYDDWKREERIIALNKIADRKKKDGQDR